jgi:site-specific recombinase XerD
VITTQSTRPIVTAGDLGANAASFARHLRAANLSPKTQRTYLDALAQFARFLADAGMPTDVRAIRREHVEAFIADQLARFKPATAANRYASLRPFFAWLIDEGELRESPMARMRKPRLPEHAPPVLSDDELRAILAACDGTGFAERRDQAIVRTFLATGARLSELANLRWTPDTPETHDIDLDLGIIRVMGKGRRERISHLGAKAVKALDRYLRLRARHRRAADPWLWLGEKGRLRESGISQALRRRGAQAGVPRLHPHLFRHTYAHEALASGMQEGEVMALAGWRSREMLSRYARSAERERALAAARRVNLGDRL